MAEPTFRDWQKTYQEAVLETDPSRLVQKMRHAEAAIFERLQQLGKGDGHLDGKGHEERMAINDAISGLRILQKERLQFPDWTSR